MPGGGAGPPPPAAACERAAAGPRWSLPSPHGPFPRGREAGPARPNARKRTRVSAPRASGEAGPGEGTCLARLALAPQPRGSRLKRVGWVAVAQRKRPPPPTWGRLVPGCRFPPPFPPPTRPEMSSQTGLKCHSLPV